MVKKEIRKSLLFVVFMRFLSFSTEISGQILPAFLNCIVNQTNLRKPSSIPFLRAAHVVLFILISHEWAMFRLSLTYWCQARESDKLKFSRWICNCEQKGDAVIGRLTHTKHTHPLLARNKQSNYVRSHPRSCRWWQSLLYLSLLLSPTDIQVSWPPYSIPYPLCACCCFICLVTLLKGRPHPPALTLSFPSCIWLRVYTIWTCFRSFS